MVQDVGNNAEAVMTTNGDIVYYNNGRSRLGKGSDSQVLTLASGLPSWASAGGVSLSNQTISPTGSQTTTSTSVTDMTGSSGGLAKTDLASRTGGKALCVFFANIEMSDSSNQYNIGFEIDGSDQYMTSNHSSANNVTGGICLSQIFALSGQTLQLRWRVAGGTATLGNGSTTASKCEILEVS